LKRTIKNFSHEEEKGNFLVHFRFNAYYKIMNFNTFVDAAPDIAWIQENADWLLLYSVASLGIMPFITIYMIETEQFNVTAGENETSFDSGEEEMNKNGTMEETKRDPTNMIEAMRYFIPDHIRLWVYVIVLVLNTIALVTTFVAIQLIRNQTATTAASRSSSLDDSQHEVFLRQVREKIREKLWRDHEQYTKVITLCLLSLN
jgi:hypothetical protein